MQRRDHEELPWVQRDSSAAYRLLVAARQGRAPQRPVERLALLQLLMQLHRQSHERTGEAPKALMCFRAETGTVPQPCAHKSFLSAAFQSSRVSSFESTVASGSGRDPFGKIGIKVWICYKQMPPLWANVLSVVHHLTDNICELRHVASWNTSGLATFLQ